MRRILYGAIGIGILLAVVGSLLLRMPAVQDAILRRGLAQQIAVVSDELFKEDALRVALCGTSKRYDVEPIRVATTAHWPSPANHLGVVAPRGDAGSRVRRARICERRWTSFYGQLESLDPELPRHALAIAARLPAE